MIQTKWCLAGLLLTSFACSSTDDWGPEMLGKGQSNADIRQMQKGRNVYATYCVGCHGEKGDGKGPAARFLDPKPRDFSKGRLKFAAVEAGQSPRVEDYHQVIQHGLTGTSMPSFKLLPADERDAVVAYIRAFYTEWGDDPPGGGLNFGQDDYTKNPAEGVEEGRNVYHSVAKCWSCHPAYMSRSAIMALHKENDQALPELRADLYTGKLTPSQWGTEIRAPNFYVDPVKNGTEIGALVRVISSGIGGTAMPTWAGSLEPEQLWGLAYYVNSLAFKRGMPAALTQLDDLRADTSTTVN